MGLLILLVIIFWGWAEVTAFIIIGGEIGGLLALIGVFLTAASGTVATEVQASTVLASLKQQVTRGGETLLTAVAESVSLLWWRFNADTRICHDGLGLLLFVPGLRTVVGLAIMSQLLKSPRFRRFAGTSGSNVHFGSVPPSMVPSKK